MLDFLAPVKGFGVTFREMFKKVDTVMYPEDKRPTAPRFHGHHQLNRWPDGLEKCIGCELCAWACPADAIYVEGRDNTPDERFSPGERYGHVYQINYLRCILCGLCIEACPTRALTMTNEYEIADDDREKLIWTKEQLLVPLLENMEAPPHPMRRDEKDYYLLGAPEPASPAPDIARPDSPPCQAPAKEAMEMDVAEVERGLLLLALQAQAAALGTSSWVKRRVEQLEFLDTRAVRWRVSIDFDVPKEAPTLLIGNENFSLIPITTLPKDNLVAFDLRDERGAALWLPTSDETSRRVGSALVVMARRALQEEKPGLPASIAEAIMLIVETSPSDRKHEEAYRLFAAAGSRIDMERREGELREASQQLYEDRFWRIRKRWRAARKWGRAQDALAEAMATWRKAEQKLGSEDSNWGVAYRLMSDSTFRSLLEELARNFVVHIGVISECKTRRIVKLTSERTVTFWSRKSTWQRLSQRLGWRCWPLDVFIGGSGGSHHLEVAAPAGVDIVRIIAKPTPPGPWRKSAKTYLRSVGGRPAVPARSGVRTGRRRSIVP